MDNFSGQHSGSQSSNHGPNIHGGEKDLHGDSKNHISADEIGKTDTHDQFGKTDHHNASGQFHSTGKSQDGRADLGPDGRNAK